MDKDIKREKNKSFWGGIILGTLIAATVLTLVFVVMISKITESYQTRLANATKAVTEDSGSLVTQSVARKADTIYQTIKNEFYFEDDIDENKMRDAIYSGIISALGDKYAEYYNEEAYAQFFTDTEGVYYGIGSYVSLDEVTGYPKLTGVFEGSPAKAAGLRDGDIIYEANGLDLGGMTLTEAVSHIKGPEGTDVTLTIVRSGESDYLHITVTRAKVESPTVNYHMEEGSLSDTEDYKIGYLQITEFDDVTSGQFEKAYTDLNSQGMEALIIDLRSNGGGNLTTVIEIADMLLPKGIVTYTEDKYGNREDYTCNGKNEIQIPLVILTNGYTASASELLSGAVRDYKKGTLIGTNTYGKGIVQTIIPMGDGTGMKITTSSYFTPNGECIHGTGIAPDIEVEFDSELYYSEEAIDNQLQYAIEYLTGKLVKN